MIKHVSVFTLKDKNEIKHFVEMLEEVGKKCPLIIKSEIGVNMSEQQSVGPHFGDVIQIVEFSKDRLTKISSIKGTSKAVNGWPRNGNCYRNRLYNLSIHSYIKEHSFKMVLFFSFYIHFYD